MANVDLKTGKKMSVEELIKTANEMRGLTLIAIHAAKSGHPGGSLSAMDLIAALFLSKMRINPKNVCWEDRDRFYLSKGHICPAIHTAAALAGYTSVEETMTLRKLGSSFQGHPHCLKLPCFEVSAGSLGQGLGAAVGSALAGKINKKDYKVYCLMGDGEQQEGSVWEAAMSASNFKLDNLVGIVDKNNLQIDGLTKDVMNVDPLNEKYKSFGWHVIEINGHNMKEILDAYEAADKIKGKPVVIIANTVKGKGVSFMENVAGWHGVATKTREQLNQALADLKLTNLDVDKYLKIAEDYGKKASEKVKKETPSFKKNYWWNEENDMKVEMEPTRFGFGKALARIGDDERIITLHADISDSIKITDFEKANPERKNRVFSVGIQEQNMISVAAGLAKEGKIPITGTYGVFAAGRCWDQIRTTVCYSNLNVKIAGAHGGISVGADGATHQALEEISLMYILPNMNLLVPCDSNETDKATEVSVLKISGPCYLRYAREATPIVTKKDAPFKFGTANIIRYRGKSAKFVDAFETKLATEYKSEKEDISIIACGPMVPEAMRAAYILKEEFNIETRIVNVHTVKPIDQVSLAKAAAETGAVITAEEHQVGGFGNIVASIILANRSNAIFDMVGVTDKFGESGEPWDLMRAFGLTAEFIVKKAKILFDKKS